MVIKKDYLNTIRKTIHSLFTRKYFWSLAVFVVIAFLFWLGEVRIPSSDSCLRVHLEQQYYCYAEKAKEISEKYGYKKGFDYVNFVMRPNAYHNVLHMAIHEVGHSAYHQTGHNVDEALGYFFENQDGVSYDFALDGYRHGIFMAHFDGMKNERPISELLRTACSPYLNVSHYADLPGTFEKDVAFQCFHGAGHAVMHANDNDLGKSLSDCDSLPHEWARQWCYYGVFMENVYVHLAHPPFYTPGMPRPSITNGSFVDLCESVSEKYRPACARFVARIVLTLKSPIEPRHFKEAFGECGKISVEAYYQDLCVRDAAVLFLPSVYRSDLAKIVSVCGGLKENIREECLEGAAIGIKLGTGGFAQQKFNLCGLVPENYSQRCYAALNSPEYVKDFK